MFFSFLKSRHGTFPFICCMKKKHSRFPLWLWWAQFFKSQRVEDLRWVSRLEVVCFLVFIPVSSCKETLGPRLSPGSQVDQLQPFVSELRKALAQARANTVLDAMRCGEMMGNWWMDGVFFVGRFPTEKDYFFVFLVDLMETQFKEHEKKPIRVAWISLRWFCVVWVNHLGSSKQRVRLGVVLVLIWNCSIPIQSQKSSSSWHGEYTPEN